MKTALKWIGIAALTPILLFLVAAALLYLPPVQNWAVRKVAAIVSEKTSMEISVEQVRLKWPLDLGIDNLRVIQHPDTIANVKHMTVDVKLWPLLKKQVVINELLLQQAKLNTDGFISDLKIKGDVGELWLRSNGIDLGQESAEINGARLSEASLDIALSDTAAVDTTESTVKWKINADSLSIRNTGITVHLPGDTLNVTAWLGHVVAKRPKADLGANSYQVASLDWKDGQLKYDNRWEPEQAGFDYNHIALTDIDLGIESISYTPAGTSFYVRKTVMKEKSGLEIKELTGGVRLDSAYSHIQLPLMTLRTPDSNIMVETDMDFSVFNPSPASLAQGEKGNEGRMKLRLFAQLGKQDIERYAGNLPQKFMEHFPNRPLIIRGSVDSNTQHIDLTSIDIDMATALHASVKGKVHNIADASRLKADLQIEAKTKELNFITALIDPKMSGIYRIPYGITLNGRLTADGPLYGADLTAHEGSGSISIKASARMPQYKADISVRQLNLHHFMPKDSIYAMTADISLKGQGTDFLSSRSSLNAKASIGLLQYGQYKLSDMEAAANLDNGRGQATVTGHNDLFDGTISVDALLSTKKIDGTISADFSKADLYQLRLSEKPITIGMCGHLDIASDMKQSHYASGLLSDLYIKDEKTTYRPGDVGLLLRTNPDTTCVRAQSGDLIVKLDASGGYEQLLKKFDILSDSVIAQYNNKVIDQPAIKRLLPNMKLHIESKQENPIANLLKSSNNIDFKELFVDITTSPETGINGKSRLYALNYDSTRIDTIRLNLTQKGERLTYQGQICNNHKNPQFVFNAMLDGHLHEHGIVAGLRYYDQKNRLGVRIGATADMEDEGIRLRLMPDRPTVGYKEFNLNKDNFIFLGSNRKIQAKIDLIADDKTGLKLYTENQDSTMLQDLTLSINRLDLGELTSVMPYLPRITGRLNGDYHILQDQNEKISVASDMAIHEMTYEGSHIGNISTEMAYLMKEDDTHAIEARLMLDDEEFGLLSGQLSTGNAVDAHFTMNRFPLSLANGFVPDQLVGLEGYGEGGLTIKGTTSRPKIDGEIYVDSAYLVSIPYGIRMRFDNDPVRIVDSRLLLENFGLYAYNDEPLNMMGSIDFSDTDRITMDMRMQARNLLLINARQEAKSIAFGKAFVNFFARMQGPVDQLRIRGRLDVLGSTDLTYMLLDSPLSTDNRLDELVKFTDFSDTTQVATTHPAPTGLEADLNINVSEGAHIICNLNTDQTNYIDLMGGGDLRMKYNSEGINLTGRYTLSNGEMKYSLPVIPLKTFTIKDGSYVEFTGDPMNPRLNITATERTKATVSEMGGGSRSVLFECGVVITRTLNNMGLEFIIDAPEDQYVSGELTTMSAEERGKIAVTMLTTGMYLADGNTNGFSMNAALSTFLQSEINSIANSAFKTLDLSLGIDKTTDATGTTHTDYSFKFAKRFMNNRLKIQIGGKVSSGADNNLGQKQSFFDNVTMEYRLDQDAKMNMKLFYSQNVYDWLEGYTGEYGFGFVWRRKLNNFWDIFRFSKNEQPMMMRQPTGNLPTMQRDSIKTDSIKINKVK